MKKNLLSILLLIFTGLATMSSRADLVWYEDFNYPDGDIRTNSSGLWIRTSGTGNDLIVNNKKLEIAATGGVPVSRQDDDYRLLTGPITNTPPSKVYASFTVICTNLPNGVGTYIAAFYSTKSSGGGFFGRIQALTNGTALPNTWRLGISANVSATATRVEPVDLALNTPYQVVIEWDPVDDLRARIWINPIDINTPFSPSTDSINAGTTNPPNAFAFRQAGTFGNAFFQVTNLALATTFDEAATNVWKTNAVAPGIVYQPKGITNFIGSSFVLSAVANGQGLRSVTYQWQKNGNDYSNPDGNTNILAFNGAGTGDNGDYTLIVTTPYGLSVTSAVAKVFISAAPLPPSFTSQPESQTAYSNQTVIFSTSVSSPGNVSYQWFSNNIAISGATSPTLTLNNVKTNFSALYKVSATNDVAPNGVVSSNAVLTVLNPAAVSIAYLRTLVDPVTFQHTNIPPTIPYQITGVVTTFTNTTSGDTASYFLQDGTAGINIFATLGSTFRPAQGDVVTFVGVLSFFSTTGLELFADTSTRPYTTYGIISNNFPLPTPITIPFDATNTYGLAYVATNLAGSLVTLTNVYFGTNAGNTISTTGNAAIIVTNASGQRFKLQFFNLDLDTAGKTLPTFAYSVTGVLYGGHPDYSVAITKFSDIVTNVISPIPLNIQLSGGNVILTWSNASFGLQSSTNVGGPYSPVGQPTGYSEPATNKSKFFRLLSP